MEVERDLNEAAAMQSGLSEEEKQQHIAEVNELKGEIASQAAATARLRHSLEERSDIIERLTANDVHQQEKINLLKVSTLSSPCDQSIFVLLEIYYFPFLSIFLQCFPAVSMHFYYLFGSMHFYYMFGKSALPACSILQILQAAATHIL